MDYSKDKDFIDLLNKWGNCDTLEAERANYDALFAYLEAVGDYAFIENIKGTFVYKMFIHRELKHRLLAPLLEPIIQTVENWLRRWDKWRARG